MTESCQCPEDKAICPDCGTITQPDSWFSEAKELQCLSCGTELIGERARISFSEDGLPLCGPCRSAPFIRNKMLKAWDEMSPALRRDNTKCPYCGMEIWGKPKRCLGCDNDLPTLDNSDFTASQDAFECAWAIVKAALPSLDIDEAAMTISPAFGMYMNPSDLSFNIKMPPSSARPLIEQNIKRRMDDESRWDGYRSDNRKIRGITDILDELRHNQSIGATQAGLLDNPLNLESRRIARHGRHPTQWNYWEQALAPKVLEYLEGLDDENDWVTAGTGVVGPTGGMQNIALLPGLGGNQLGSHLLGSMLQNTGSVHDRTFTPGAFNLWRNMGNRLTEGGDKRRYKAKSWWELQGDEEPLSRGGFINQTKKDDFTFNEPVIGGKGWRWPSKGMLEGDRYSNPHPHPYEFETVHTGNNPTIAGQHPLQISYSGNEPTPVTDIPTHVHNLEQGGALRNRPAMDEILADTNEDDFIRRRIAAGLLGEGWQHDNY